MIQIILLQLIIIIIIMTIKQLYCNSIRTIFTVDCAVMASLVILLAKLGAHDSTSTRTSALALLIK